MAITALAAPLNVTVAEPGYTGPFTLNAQSCAGIATIAPATGPGNFIVTGVAPGECAITFTDQFAQSAGLSVSVTTSSIVTH